MNSYLLKALNIALSQFIASNRTFEAKKEAFLLWYLRDLEGIFSRAVNPAYGYIQNCIVQDINNNNNSYKRNEMIWITLSVLRLIGLLLFWKITYNQVINETDKGCNHYTKVKVTPKRGGGGVQKLTESKLTWGGRGEGLVNQL